MKTIKEIADEIGVSKQAIQKRLAREPLYTRIQQYISTKNGTKYIDGDGENLIKTAFTGNSNTDVDSDVADNQKIDVYRVIQIFEENMKALQSQISEKDKQIAVKDRQIAEKDKQLDTLSSALLAAQQTAAAAQALHAETIKQLESSEVYVEETREEAPGRGFFGFFRKKNYRE